MPWSGVDTEYSIHRVQHTPSTAYTEYSIHRVQHTLSTAYPAYCIIPRSTVTRSQPVSYLGRPCCTQVSTFAQLRIDRWMKSPMLLSCLPPDLPPPSTTPILIDHGFQVYLPTPQLRLPSVSLSSLDPGLQVHLQTRSITASKYILKERRPVYGDTGVTVC